MASGVGGLADDRMPVGHGELAGDQGGAPAVPIFEDLQQVVARLIIERAKPPVVQDQELDGAPNALRRRPALPSPWARASSSNSLGTWT